MKRVTSVVGLDDRMYLPRVGKIHLGEMATSASGKEYPTATEYFVVPPEVAAVFGERPTEIDVMFPSDDLSEIFPVAYKSYRGGVGLWCVGDGSKANRVSDAGGILEVECTCELLASKKCRLIGNLMVVIPKVSIGGVYQIDTGSRISIGNVRSGFEFARNLLGRASWVPFTLRLQPREISVDGKKKAVHVLGLTLATFERILAQKGELAAIREAVTGPVDTRRLVAAPEQILGSGEVEEPTIVVPDEAPQEPPPQPAYPTAVDTINGEPVPSSSSGADALAEGEIRRIGKELGKPHAKVEQAIRKAKQTGSMQELLRSARALYVTPVGQQQGLLEREPGEEG